MKEDFKWCSIFGNVPFCAEMIHYSPLEAMQLILEFGLDTDSYAQLMGAIIGAIFGKTIFPAVMRHTVNKRSIDQFGQNVDDWMNHISVYFQSHKPDNIFIEKIVECFI